MLQAILYTLYVVMTVTLILIIALGTLMYLAQKNGGSYRWEQYIGFGRWVLILVEGEETTFMIFRRNN